MADVNWRMSAVAGSCRCLLFPGSPTQIALLIAAITVNAVQCHSWSRSPDCSQYVTDKSNRVRPFGRIVNTAPTVAVVVLVGRVVATPSHVVPDLVQGVPGQAVRLLAATVLATCSDSSAHEQCRESDVMPAAVTDQGHRTYQTPIWAGSPGEPSNYTLAKALAHLDRERVRTHAPDPSGMGGQPS